jgi:cytolysin-activating lysine-acyltransferase
MLNRERSKFSGDIDVMTSDPKGGPPNGASASMTVSQMLGEICWVLSQSKLHRHFSLGDLEWMVMPPILANQFRVFRHGNTPVGVALWAYLSEEAERRFTAQVEAGAGARLQPQDWKSGDRLWVIELIALEPGRELQLTRAMVGDLAENVFKNQKMRMFVTDAVTGKRTMKEIGG